MSILSEQGEGTVAGLSDAGALRTQRDRDGKIINGNQQQLVLAARRQGQMKSHKTEEQRRSDAAFMSTWAPDSAANNAPSPSFPFYNAAQIALVLASKYNVASEDNVYHLNKEDVLNEHAMMELLEQWHLDEVA